MNSRRWSHTSLTALPALLAVLASTPAVVAQDTMAMASESSRQLTAADAAGLEAPALPLPEGSIVTVRTLASERQVEFDIGPMELTRGMAHLRLPIQLAEFPIDGWIHGFEVEMRDGAGNELPLDMLHHVNFIDPDKRELFSPIARRVMAAGRETMREKIPGIIGYPVSDGDRMLIATMFANTTDRDIPDAHLLVRFFYSTEADGLLQPRDVYPFYLDVMGPTGIKDFAVGPGTTVKHWEGSPAVDGRILGIGGHAHDYATKLTLLDVTDGRTVWETEPEVDNDGRLVGVPSGSFLWTLGRKIHADHTYRISVEYQVPEGESAPDGGMGAIGGVVWIGRNTVWPEFDRGDDTYVADLINTLAAPARMTGHAGMAGDADQGGHGH